MRIMRIKVGKLSISVHWKPIVYTKLWKGGELSITFMLETEKLRRVRNRFLATAKRREEERIQ